MEYGLRSSYPSAPESRQLCHGIWRAIFGNRRLAVIPALLYGILLELSFPGFGGPEPWLPDASPLVLVALLLAGTYYGLAPSPGCASGPGGGPAIDDHKCFLRLRIGSDGDLTLYPVKIERTVRWEFAADGGAGGSGGGTGPRAASSRSRS